MTNCGLEKNTWTVGYNHPRERMRMHGCCFLSLSLPSLKLVIVEYSVSKFLNLGTINILDQIFLCCGVLSSALRMFSSISGFYPLDAKSTPQLWKLKCLQIWTNVPSGANHSGWALLPYMKQNDLFPRNSGGKFLTNYLFVCSNIYKSYIFNSVNLIFFL